MLLQIQNTLSWYEALRLQSWGFWLLLSMAVLILYIFWERFWKLYNATNLPAKLLENIKPLIRIGDKATSLKLCKNHHSPSARLLAVGVGKLGKPFREIQDTMQQEALLYIQVYEQRLGYLILLSEIAPAFGLCLVLIQTQFLSIPFQFVQLLSLWVGWLLGFLGNIGYNILVMRIRATKHTLDKTIHLWLGFLQEN